MRSWSKTRISAPPLSLDEKVRQGKAVRSAQLALTSTDAVRAFLNTHQKLLGGRPIDLAIESAAGLIRVEQFLEGQAEIERAGLLKYVHQPEANAPAQAMGEPR
ncbi:MAG TPA: hypothetical protein VGD10_09625 [Allosphingosinicella sp.]|uniref:hypothetical protein n=1 Tax=Allosphingosinicella sp. TaxID=2823234 RepID=UPI002ED7B54F